MLPARTVSTKPSLKGTSQGSKTDIPPKQWIPQELRDFGAYGTGKNDFLVDIPYDGTIFDRSQFLGFSDERYNALTPALALSTKLLMAAGPYLCNFFPVVFEHPPRPGDGSDDDTADNDDRRGWGRVLVNYKRSAGEIEDAIAQFKEMMRESVTFDESKLMWPRNNWMGLNHPDVFDQKDRRWGHEMSDQYHGYVRGDERDQGDGLPRRQIVVTLASQILDSLMRAAPGSEGYSKCVFFAAINLTHELGHTIYAHDFNNRMDPTADRIGEDVCFEHGHSLIGWLFSGWIPEINDIGILGDNQRINAEAGFHWFKWPKRSQLKPLFQVYYSIPLDYIRRVLSNDTWQQWPELTDDHPEYSKRARDMILNPGAPFRIGHHARMAKEVSRSNRNWLTEQTGYAGWASDFMDDDCGDDWEDNRPWHNFIDEDWDDTPDSDRGVRA